MLADIERRRCSEAAEALAATGVDVLTVAHDVSLEADVEALAATRRSSTSATCTWCATTPVSAAAACPSPSCRWRTSSG